MLAWVRDRQPFRIVGHTQGHRENSGNLGQMQSIEESSKIWVCELHSEIIPIQLSSFILLR